MTNQSITENSFSEVQGNERADEDVSLSTTPKEENYTSVCTSSKKVRLYVNGFFFNDE